MELDKQYELNPEDIDTIFRAIKNNIEQKKDDLDSTLPLLIAKYKHYQLQDNDKKLIHRFHTRVSELFEKCKNQNSIDYILSIRDILNYDCSDFNFILKKIHKKFELVMQENIEESNQTFVKKPIPSWQFNIQDNKCLFQFYDQDFWKLYDIMQLQKQYCSNLIIFHQARQENSERLYNQSLERNKRINSIQLQPNFEMNILLERAQQLKNLQINNPLSTQYINKTIVMFRNPSPNKNLYRNNKYSLSISPKKTQNKDPKNQKIDIQSIFDSDNINLYVNNCKLSQNKNKQVLHNDKYIQIINESFKQKNKLKIFQENCSPQKIDNKQDLFLPKIKSPHSFEQKGIKIRYLRQNKYNFKFVKQ
ncbi:unnamed protein product [Paramecium sonneborni]|uniref:Uncharacterized protein n=1 Tax=Paramecium sonneborni TaxID=65129 RepID=A0A8S1NXX8_9CILI|nr:unnamed protein product [Paramecium sonneborni]